ncbi:MAG: hypothetical protein KDC26_09250 [Armatimonadetes bacterium]|nr:hypothetical protein [Armatimonadota bacterium]
MYYSILLFLAVPPLRIEVEHPNGMSMTWGRFNVSTGERYLSEVRYGNMVHRAPGYFNMDSIPTISADVDYYPMPPHGKWLEFVNKTGEVIQLDERVPIAMEVWDTVMSGNAYFLTHSVPMRHGRDLGFIKSEMKKWTKVHSYDIKEESLEAIGSLYEIGAPLFPLGDGRALFVRWISDEEHDNRISLELVERDTQLNYVRTYHTKERDELLWKYSLFRSPYRVWTEVEPDVWDSYAFHGSYQNPVKVKIDRKRGLFFTEIGPDRKEDDWWTRG